MGIESSEEKLQLMLWWEHTSTKLCMELAAFKCHPRIKKTNSFGRGKDDEIAPKSLRALEDIAVLKEDLKKLATKGVSSR